MIGITGNTNEELVSKLCDKINEYNKTMNIPKSMKEYGITEEEFLEKLPSISNNAVLDACTGSNPRSITNEEMEKLLKCCYYGTEVDF